VQVFTVDMGREQLIRIFEAGSRTFNPRATWAVGLNTHKLLIQVSGAGFVLFDPQAARARMMP
jgi:hypothetical protein